MAIKCTFSAIACISFVANIVVHSKTSMSDAFRWCWLLTNSQLILQKKKKRNHFNFHSTEFHCPSANWSLWWLIDLDWVLTNDYHSFSHIKVHYQRQKKNVECHKLKLIKFSHKYWIPLIWLWIPVKPFLRKPRCVQYHKRRAKLKKERKTKKKSIQIQQSES